MKEVFADPSRDESLIVKLLDFKPDVGDIGNASWFLNDLAREQDAEGFQICDSIHSDLIPCLDRNLHYQLKLRLNLTLMEHDERHCPPPKWRFNCLVPPPNGYKAISKGRQGREAKNLVRVYVANIRPKGVATDVLVTAYEPTLINPLSESAVDVGAGLAVPASQSGIMPMCDVIKQSLSTFKVNDWSLFDSSV